MRRESTFPAGRAFAHEALLYSGRDDYAARVGSFLTSAVERDEPAMAAVPGANVALLREAVDRHARAIRFVDMAELGANPWRIIPEVRRWVDEQGGRRAHFVGEPIWAGRAREETAEAIRHESLINVAFRHSPAHVLCPYDARALGADVLSDAGRTHPVLICDGGRHASDHYDGAALALGDEPLSEPPARATEFPITPRLTRLRRALRRRAEAAGLGHARVEDTVLAATEAATNAALHGDEPGVLRVWLEHDRLVCEVDSPGAIADPLAGRLHPGPLQTRGRGLWLINQLCDLVEIRCGPPRTVVRMHMLLPA